MRNFWFLQCKKVPPPSLPGPPPIREILYKLLVDTIWMKFFCDFSSSPWAWPWGRGKSPWNRKYFCGKMMLFPKALFVVTNFPKIILKNLFFYWKFIKNFQNFPTPFVFFPNSRQMLVKFFEKYAKIMHFRTVLRKFSKILMRPGGGRSAPGPPTKPTPKNVPL